MGVGETPLPELQWHEQWRGLDVNDFRPSPLNVGQKKCHFGHFLGKKNFSVQSARKKTSTRVLATPPMVGPESGIINFQAPQNPLKNGGKFRPKRLKKPLKIRSGKTVGLSSRKKKKPQNLSKNKPPPGGNHFWQRWNIFCPPKPQQNVVFGFPISNLDGHWFIARMALRTSLEN